MIRTTIVALLVVLATASVAAAQASPSLGGGIGLLPFPEGISVADSVSGDAVPDIEIQNRFAWLAGVEPADYPAAMAGTRLVYEIGRDEYLDNRRAEQFAAAQAALAAEPAIPNERAGVVGDAVELTIGGATPATPAQLAEAAARLEPLRGPLPGGGFEFDLAMSGGFVRFTFTEAGLAYRTAELLDDTIAAIGRRLARIDVVATARSQGDDRIVLTVAGPGRDEAIAAIARGSGFVSLHLVADTLRAPPPEPLPPGLRAVPDANDPGIVQLVDESPIFGFSAFAGATVGIEPYSGFPVVTFTLTPEGTRAFAEATTANVGRSLAIVVGGVVVSAPTIREPILGGVGVIAGNFDRREADAIAEAILAGGLPAPATLVETRTVDEAWPVAAPAVNRGALAVEIMAEGGFPVLQWEIAAVAYWAGLGKTGLQRLDGDDRFAVLTMPVPDGSAAARAKALELLRKRLEGLYSIRAVWELGPLLVLDRDVGFVPG